MGVSHLTWLHMMVGMWKMMNNTFFFSAFWLAGPSIIADSGVLGSFSTAGCCFLIPELICKLELHELIIELKDIFLR